MLLRLTILLKTVPQLRDEQMQQQATHMLLCIVHGQQLSLDGQKLLCMVTS